MLDKDRIHKYVARLLMVSFFMPPKLQVIVLFGSCIYFIVASIKAKEYPEKRNYLSALGLGSIYFLFLAALAFTPAPFSRIAHNYSEWRISYILLPIVTATWSARIRQIVFNELPYFIYTCFLACLVTNGYFLVKYLTAPTGFKDVNHVTYRVFFEEFIGLHPTYISMYLAFCLGLLLVVCRQMNRTLKYFLFYSLILFILALFAKSPLIALAVIICHFGWINKSRLLRYKWLFAGMLAVMVAAYAFIPFVSQRAHEMVGISGETLKSNVIDNSISERKMIWSVDNAMLHQYWMTGCGPGRLLYLLKQRYFFYSVYYGHDISSFDPHNEYFYEWLSFGMIGIGILFLTLGYQLFKAINRNNYIYLYLLTILGITFFTESVLARQQGVIFYAFFTSLFFFMTNSKKLNTTIR